MEINYTIKNVREGTTPNTYYVSTSYEYDGLNGEKTFAITESNPTKDNIINKVEQSIKRIVEDRIKALNREEQFTELQKSIIGKYTTNR